MNTLSYAVHPGGEDGEIIWEMAREIKASPRHLAINFELRLYEGKGVTLSLRRISCEADVHFR